MPYAYAYAHAYVYANARVLYSPINLKETDPN